MFYTKPTLTTLSIVANDEFCATPWEAFTKGGTVADGSTSSFDAQMSGTLVSGGNA